MYFFAIACLSVLTLIFSDFAQEVIRKSLSVAWERRGPLPKVFAAGAAFLVLASQSAFAAAGDEAAAGEANLKLPDLSSVQFMGVNGHKLLLLGILFCIFGLVF